jgi:hypothetical protein
MRGRLVLLLALVGCSTPAAPPACEERTEEVPPKLAALLMTVAGATCEPGEQGMRCTWIECPED